jgi:hypothetical protein
MPMMEAIIDHLSLTYTCSEQSDKLRIKTKAELAKLKGE